MMLERRDSAAPDLEEKPAADGGKKPVIIYILVLFLVAFLLMTLSLLSHQRSNAEAIGQLQGSVSAMQEVQGLQEQVIQLQKELSEAEKKIKQLEEDVEQTQEAWELSEEKCIAFAHLTTLAEEHLNGDYEACRHTINNIETNGYDRLYPITTKPDLPSPNSLYERIKADVEAQTAEPTKAGE